MSGAGGGPSRPGWTRLAGPLLAAACLAFAALVYWGIGPPPGGDRAWYEPTGFLDKALSLGALSDLVADLGTAQLGFGLISVALAASVFFTTRSAVARYLAVFSIVVIQIVLYYSLQADAVWQFFRWRWGGSIFLFSLVVAGALTAPLLARSWLALGWPLRLVVFLPILAVVLFIERNVTGTDQSLSFAISPWPVVQLFGIELIATCTGALILGAAIGLYGLHRALRGERFAALPLLVGTVAVAAIPVFALWLGSENDLLPFQAGGGMLGLMAILALLVFGSAAAVSLISGRRENLIDRSRVWAVGAALVLVPSLMGQLWARADYTTTREDRAEKVIAALLEYYGREETYPDRLDELVEAQLIAAVPTPSIGFGGNQEFVYQNFGDSFILEFSAPRWIQCAYNPPYPEEMEEGYEEEEEDGGGYEDDSGGAWSCPSKPPELW